MTHIDPWLSKSGETDVPEGARFLWVHQIDTLIDPYLEAAFLLRITDADQLWIVRDPSERFVQSRCSTDEFSNESDGMFMRSGLAISLPREPELSNDEVGSKLLGRLFRVRWDHDWPEKLVLPGAFGNLDYQRIVQGIEKEAKDNCEDARKHEGEIIREARKQRLDPHPSVRGKRFWKAACPTRNHHLDISSERELFYCGYCREKGGAEELRQLCEVRRQKRWS